MKKWIPILLTVMLAGMIFWSCSDDKSTEPNPETPAGMVFIQGGTYSMGDEVGDLWDWCRPVHSVTIDNYYISKYEITQAEWLSTMGSNPSYFTGDLHKPVEQVSWYAILKYCNLRSTAEGLSACYKIKNSTNPVDWGEVPSDYNTDWDAVICDWTANGYRLPTDAEFEYASRGGLNWDEYNYLYSGSNDVNEVAWYDTNNDPYGTKPTGTKAPNELGIYDMSGNLYEWCWDWYGSYTSDAQNNPTGPSTGAYRVLRGGYWHSSDHYCRVANRGGGDPFYSSYDLGFRILRTP